MTAATPAKARRRTTVPAPVAAGGSAAFATLTGEDSEVLVRLVPLAQLRPHPHNPRRDLGDLTELTDSIKAHGVRQNLLVVPNPDEAGTYRIVIGHRRAAAAAASGQVVAVPAAIDPTLTEVDQRELMLLENIQRSDLTPVEEADGYQGLLDLGVDVAAIAKKTGRAKKTITSRLKLVGLPDTARQAVHTHQATIEDGLALADFQGPDEFRQILVDHFGKPGFMHQVETTRRDVERAARRQALTEGLEAAGVTVLTPDHYWEVPKGCTELYLLAAAGTKGHTPFTPEEHESCPGHAGWIAEQGYGNVLVRYGCTDPKGNGHRSLAYSPAKPETTKEERRELIANNKAGAAAETVRRAWIRDHLLTAKVPADGVVYAARVLHAGGLQVHPEVDLYRDLAYAGKTPTAADVAKDLAKPHLALRHLLAVAIARVEAGMPKDFWRSTYHTDIKATHLAALAAWGYELSDLEAAFVKTHRGTW